MKLPEWVALVVAGFAAARITEAHERIAYWTPIYERWSCRYIGCNLQELRALRKERAAVSRPAADQEQP